LPGLDRRIGKPPDGSNHLRGHIAPSVSLQNPAGRLDDVHILVL
jgi:hypothetical protein